MSVAHGSAEDGDVVAAGLVGQRGNRAQERRVELSGFESAHQLGLAGELGGGRVKALLGEESLLKRDEAQHVRG